MVSDNRSRGSALILALLFVAVFGALAVGFITGADASVRNSQLYLSSRRAHLTAESGLSLAQRVLPTVDLGIVEAPAEVLSKVAAALDSRYATTLFKGTSCVVSGTTLTVPALILNGPEGVSRLQMTITSIGGDRYRVRATGSNGEASKSLDVIFSAQADTTIISHYGVASKSRIVMTGNTEVIGKNRPSEGSVLSASRVHMDPLYITGRVEISGNAAITNPLGDVVMKGASEIGGDIMIGVPEPPFPTIDTSIFAPYATNVLSASISTYTDARLENIRILPNTNPTFTGSTVIRGIMYVESPNKITFTGGVDIIGAIAVKNNGASLNLDSNYIKFAGNCTSNSVAALPADTKYDGLRELSGAFILAPGFRVEFAGNFSTINGSIVASQMKFTGSAYGVVKGSVLNYDETDYMMTGDSHLEIDHDGLNEDPAGLLFPRRLVYLRGTYNE